MHLPIKDVQVLCAVLKFFHTTSDKLGEFISPKGEVPMEKLITLAPPTKPMQTEAVKAGYYETGTGSI